MAKLTPQQRAYVRRRSKMAKEDLTDDELNIIPFLDIVINLIMFLLMVTTSLTAYTEVAVAMPDISPAPGERPVPPRLNLNVILTPSGIHVLTSGKRLDGSCSGSESLDGAPAIPMRFGQYDWSALRTCAATVRRQAESTGIEFRNVAGQGEVTLSADPIVEYQELIHAMDALRGDERQSLFPGVLLSAGVR